MELRQLRYLNILAEAGSFHRAAHWLGLRQPALSQSIRALGNGYWCATGDTYQFRQPLDGRRQCLLERSTTHSCCFGCGGRHCSDHGKQRKRTDASWYSR
ncbi:LysR family transcriptional regulator [Azospirillum sp. INR13]|nr:LysR family transcriptional regulator [Azospirillum sp. INR13]